MSTLTINKKMLYCPKCKRTYEDGSQRFCNNDGGRLLASVTSVKKQKSRQEGVFTSLLGRSSSNFDRDENLTPKPPVRKVRPKHEEFNPQGESPVFLSERILAPDLRPKQEVRRDAQAPKPAAPVREESKSVVETDTQEPLVELEIEMPHQEGGDKPVAEDVLQRPVFETSMLESVGAGEPQSQQSLEDAPPVGKPMARLIDPKDIDSGRAPLGDRALHPSGRNPVSWGDTDVLIGQTVKGRYRILKTLDSDQSSIAYLAEDNILKGKKCVVRVLMQGSGNRGFEDKIFLEERVSLSHVDHPNVAKVIDSGELQEGKPFIVTSELRGSSAANLFDKAGELNPMRVARIIRQASYALSEAHQNGILHRNLKPEHLLLTVSETGIEQVKVTDFCVSDGKVTVENFSYKAPEQIGGQLPTFASDSYSLAVIAYQLLTKRFPFEGRNQREVLAAQKAGLVAKPSELNPKLLENVDEIFVRALAYDPSDRFPKARDFGEVFFNAVSDEHMSDEPIPSHQAVEVPESAEEIPANLSPGDVSDLDSAAVDAVPDRFSSDIHIDSSPETDLSFDDIETDADEHEDEGKVGYNESLWQKRSPEALTERGFLFTIITIVGAIVLGIGVIGVWYYFMSHEAETVENVPQSNTNIELNSKGVDSPARADKSPAVDIDIPPPPRQISAPANFQYFENSKLKLNDNLTKKFRGFSIYYPKTWKSKQFDKVQNRVDDKFLDIAKSDKNGIPIEQLIISPYESSGTFTDDTGLFTALVEKSNRDTADSVRPASFKVISQGATTIQDGRWKAYQVNFESVGELDGKPFSIWGRRLWIPIQRPGAKTGFIITMVATSLSTDVKSADDVGKAGELKRILSTFEPDQAF